MSTRECAENSRGEFTAWPTHSVLESLYMAAKMTATRPKHCSFAPKRSTYQLTDHRGFLTIVLTAEVSEIRKGTKRLDPVRISIVRQLTYSLKPLKSEDDDWKKYCTEANVLH